MKKIYMKIGLGEDKEEMVAFYPALEVEYENEEDLKKKIYERVDGLVEAALFELSLRRS